MINISTKYAYHIDELRRKAKIKVNDFCDGICSDRQYRRYLSGIHEVPQRSIILFAEKLGLSPSDFFSSFYLHDTEEYQKISSIYRNMRDLKWDIVHVEINALKDYNFLSIGTKRLYDYCVISTSHQTKKTTSHYAYDLFKKLIDYPNCLNKEIFDIVDVIAVQSIANIEFNIGKEEAIIFLYRILHSREFVYVSSNNRYILPTVYARLSRILGMKGSFSETEKITSIGIVYSLSIGDIYALSHLYYYKSLALYRLGKINLSMIEAKKCLAAAIAKDNNQELEMFIKLIKNDYSINPMDLFLPGFIKN